MHAVLFCIPSRDRQQIRRQLPERRTPRPPRPAWSFKVALIGLDQTEPKASYPRVVKRVGAAAPPEPDLDEAEEA